MPGLVHTAPDPHVAVKPAPHQPEKELDQAVDDLLAVKRRVVANGADSGDGGGDGAEGCGGGGDGDGGGGGGGEGGGGGK